METLHFEFTPAVATAATPTPPRPWALAGVLASGNLEVLVEATPPPDAAETDAPPPVCQVEIHTAAHGFSAVWRAVCNDFFARHGAALAGLRISVNDAGATPAVVSLRLDQALREFCPPAQKSDREFQDWHV
jgi:malonate decarboxylase delta subunit